MRFRVEPSVAIASGRVRESAPLLAVPLPSAGGTPWASKYRSDSRVVGPIPRPSVRAHSAQRRPMRRRSTGDVSSSSPRITDSATSSSQGEVGVSRRSMSRSPPGHAAAMAAAVPSSCAGRPSALPAACPSSMPRARSGSVGTGLTTIRLRLSFCRTRRHSRSARAQGTVVSKDTLSITDNRTGQSYEVPVSLGTIKAMDLRQVKVDAEDFGLMTYDPAFMNTAACKSAITFIDGDKGILRYRGYPIEQLAERSSFLEVAYLLRNGELPTQPQYDDWTHQITYHTYVHENIKTFLQGFRYDAHPMSMLLSSVGALSSFYPQAHNIMDPEQRNIEIIRLIAKLPTIAAFILRHMRGLPFVYPDNDL